MGGVAIFAAGAGVAGLIEASAILVGAAGDDGALTAIRCGRGRGRGTWLAGISGTLKPTLSATFVRSPLFPISFSVGLAFPAVAAGSVHPFGPAATSMPRASAAASVALMPEWCACIWSMRVVVLPNPRDSTGPYIIFSAKLG